MAQLRAFDQKITERQVRLKDVENALNTYRYERKMDSITTSDVYSTPDKYFGKAQDEVTQSQYDKDPLMERFKILIEVDDHTKHEKGREVKNEDDSRKVKAFDEIRLKYFDMKWQWYLVKNEESFRLSTLDIESAIQKTRKWENQMNERLEFMYQLWDYDNDRA